MENQTEIINGELQPIDFNAPQEQQETTQEVASDLVGQAFQQAVVHQVANDVEVQDKLLDSAKEVINNRVDAIKTQAETESKKANFNNKKGACECFGYNEDTTERWAVETMNGWHNVMTGIWIVIGAVTFAPITFVAKKIKVILKASWVAILVAILIYILVLTSPIWAKYLYLWIEQLSQ